jgi:hypothetical protein
MNYDKWDKMAAEISDSDDESPMVHSFDKPQSVKIGPEGTIFSEQVNSTALALGSHGSTPTEISPSQSPDNTISHPYSSKESPIITSSSPPEASPSPELTEDLCENGGKTSLFYWSQTKDHVCLFILLPDGTKARNVSVRVEARHLNVKVHSKVLVDGHFKYEVKPPMEPEDLEWEVLTHTSAGRLLKVCLVKSCPIERAIFWWSCVLAGDDPIDTTAIKGRQKSDNASLWQAAHVAFTSKAGSRTPISILTDGAQ